MGGILNIEQSGMHFNHDFYVVVGKQCRTLVYIIYYIFIYRYSVGDPSTHFLYNIDYQQQHKSRNSNACLFFRSIVIGKGHFIYWLINIIFSAKDPH